MVVNIKVFPILPCPRLDLKQKKTIIKPVLHDSTTRSSANCQQMPLPWSSVSSFRTPRTKNLSDSYQSQHVELSPFLSKYFSAPASGANKTTLTVRFYNITSLHGGVGVNSFKSLDFKHPFTDSCGECKKQQK